MKKYLAVIKIAYISVLENRVEILIANLQAVFSLFVLFYFWQAVFSTQTTIRGYTFPQIITYYFLVRIIYSRVSTFGAASIAKGIRSGDISKYLVRPYDFTLYHILVSLTKTTMWTIGDMFAISIFSIYLYRYLVAPLSLIYGAMFLVVFFLNGLLSAEINLCIGYIGFWIGEVTHLKVVSTTIITILSGALVPLTFFPSWFEFVSRFLPFKYLVQFPADIYFGKFDIANSLSGIGILALWVILFFGIANYLLRKGLIKYESYN